MMSKTIYRDPKTGSRLFDIDLAAKTLVIKRGDIIHTVSIDHLVKMAYTEGAAIVVLAQRSKRNDNRALDATDEHAVCNRGDFDRVI